MVSFQHKGQIQLTVNKQGRGGNIQVVREQNVSKHSFKCLPISNKTGLDCLKQTHSNADLTVIGMISAFQSNFISTAVNAYNSNTACFDCR